MTSCERGRPGPGVTAPEPTDAETDPDRFGPVQLFQLRLPARRMEQLCALADGRQSLATSMVAEWVLERLALEDPTGELLPRPGRVTANGRLAPVTRLPKLSMLDPEAADGALAPVTRLDARKDDSRQAGHHAAPAPRPRGSEAHPAGTRRCMPRDAGA